MKFVYSLAMFAVVLGISGCKPEVAVKSTDTTSPQSVDYLVTTEPADAVSVGEARSASEDGQEVTLVGRIGGSSKPFVDGLAAFTIVDPKVPYCADDEDCPTPWDYCCETAAVKENIATIKLVDQSGKTVNQSARDLLPIKELSLVVVKGTAKRDDQGNLTVAANQVFVRPGE